MKYNSWLRFFLSYLSVFLFLSISLSVTFIALIGQNANREAKNANLTFTQNAAKTFDSRLNTIEQLVIHESLTNIHMQSFFNGDHADEAYSNYLLYSRLRELLLTTNGIDSFYLYRTSDQRVLSDSHIMTISEFKDRAFIDSFLGNPRQSSWFPPRSYPHSSGGSPQQVVSLVKGIPFGTASQGIIVINIPLYSLQDILSGIAASDIHYAYLATADTDSFIAGEQLEKEDITSVVSEATGWLLHSGLKQGTVGGLLSLISNFWILLAVFFVVAGLGLLVIVFRRNYKPIDAISSRIQRYIRKDLNDMEGNQFSFIESAIDKLIEESQLHEEQGIRDLRLKQRFLFRDIITGSLYNNFEEWQEELEKVQPGFGNCSYLVILVEIDHYRSFEETYTKHDRMLLKFALQSVVEEITEQHHLSVWVDWLSENRLYTLVFVNVSEELALPMLAQMCEELRQWVEQHLKFTVTIGLGDIESDVSSIPASYDKALQMLELKASAGPNRVITNEVANVGAPYAIYDYLDTIHSFAYLFRTGSREWEEAYRSVFAGMRSGMPSRKKIVELTEYLLHYFNREMIELGAEATAEWNHLLPKLHGFIDGFSTVDELEEQLYLNLDEFFSEMVRLRENNLQFRNLDLFKIYMKTHLSDHNLSLKQISEHFNLSPQHFSVLFKELQGEKFVDYLIRVRMEKGRELLETTELSVQDVALQVGYIHAFSFIRAFKKITGSTPGEFRKNNHQE